MWKCEGLILYGPGRAWATITLIWTGWVRAGPWAHGPGPGRAGDCWAHGEHWFLAPAPSRKKFSGNCLVCLKGNCRGFQQTPSEIKSVISLPIILMSKLKSFGVAPTSPRPILRFALLTTLPTWGAKVSLVSRVIARSRTSPTCSSLVSSIKYGVRTGARLRVIVNDLHLLGFKVNPHLTDQAVRRSSQAKQSGSFTVWRAVQDERPLEVLTPARFFMLHVHTLQYNDLFHQPIPSYTFIVEREIKKLEDKHYPLFISSKNSEI